MDTTLIVLVSLLVGGFALAFYMDWLGLWVSKEEMKEEIARAKERVRQLEQQSGWKAPETGANPKEDLLPSGRGLLGGAGLEAGAHSCLTVPINAKEVASVLAHAQAGNQPGRHTLNLERAEALERWQDEGGPG